MAQPKNINGAILGVLESIDAKLDASAAASSQLNTNLQGMAKTGVVSEKEYESFSKMFGILAKGITALVKSLDTVSEKTGEKFKNLITNIGKTISDFFLLNDEKKVNTFIVMMATLGKGIFLYALAMVVATPFLLLAPIGAFLFGLSIRILFLAMGTAGVGGAKKIAAMKLILDMTRGIFLFALAMVVVTLLAPFMLLGALVFGLSIRILFMAMGTAGVGGAKKIAAMKLILEMARGILLFALAMIVVTLLAPFMLLGALVFGLTMRILFLAMGRMSIKKLIVMSQILSMAKGILLFALAMVVVSILTPLMLLGALVFGLSVRLLFLVMGRMSVKKLLAMYMIGLMAKGAIFFALGMALIGLIAPLFIKGVLLFAAAVFLMMLVLKLAGKPASLKGILALVIISFVVLLWALIFPFFDANASWGAILKVVVTLAGIALVMWFIGKIDKSIMKGSIALAIAAGAVLVIALAMLVWKSADPSWEDIAKLGATVVIVGLIGLLAGLGPIPVFIALGSLAMIAAGAAVMLIALAMNVWMAAGVKLKDVGILGATVAMIGIEMALLGLASPFILAGSFAMSVAAIPLILLTGSLAVFKTIGWKATDGDMLINALDSVVAGFLGGRMPGGIFAMIKFAAVAAARAVLMLITIPPFLLAGVALIPITLSLKTFKSIKWTPNDSIALEGVMASLVKSFSLPGDYARQKELGIYTNPFMLRMGIWALRDAGSTMASLAEGIQSFANLTVPIYGWVETEGGGGELKIVEKRPMSKGDFKLAGEGMATVIGAIAAPLAEVGRLEAGGSSGNPILDAIFAGNFVSKGVSALRNAGDTIVGLAEGVQSFANLTIPTYGLVTSTDKQGNTNTKLQVVARTPMTEGDITSASNNISMVIGVVAGALAKVGKDEAASSGWFSGGNVARGAAALAGVGDNIKAIADTVKGYADLTIFPMELVDGGTKDAKLVPGKPIVLTDDMLKKAAEGLSTVLGIVVDAVADVGRKESESSGWFSGGNVSKGKKALGNIGLNIKAIADAVIGFATASFTPMGPDKDGNLVAIGPSVKLGPTELSAAATALGSIISLMGQKVADFGKWAAKNDKHLTLGNTSNILVSEIVNLAMETVQKMEKIPLTAAEEYVAKMSMIFTGVYNIFSAENAPTVSKSSWYFSKFSNNMVNIAKNASGIQKASVGFMTMSTASLIWVGGINKLNSKKANEARWLVDSMSTPSAWKGAQSISKSTVQLKEQINGLDIERLKILNSLMCALAQLGNSNISLDKLGSSLGEGMKEGFELLAEYLATLIDQGAGGGGGGLLGGALDAVGLGGGGDKPAPKGKDGKPAAPAAAPPAGDMIKKFKQALEGSILNVRIKT